MLKVTILSHTFLVHFVSEVWWWEKHDHGKVTVAGEVEEQSRFSEVQEGWKVSLSQQGRETGVLGKAGK